MPAVHQRPDLMAPKSLLASWLSALIAMPLSLLVGAAGQGVGALAARGGWIGISVPWDRQFWALVNQPVLNFAALPSATGYWLGSLVLPLAVAVVLPPLALRLGSLTAQLLVVHTAWSSLTVAAGWQLALDPELSHPVRWLEFRGFAPELRFAIVGATAVAVVPVVMRLLAVARITRYRMSRTHRIVLVLLHLVPVPVGWAVCTVVLRGAIPVESCIAAGVPLAIGLGVAWIGYPAALTHPLAPVRFRALAGLALGLVVVWTIFVAGGRPLPDHRAAALQWARDGSFNNIRDWMEPRRAPWLDD